MDDFGVETVTNDRHGIVIVRGELDAFTGPQLKEALSGLAEEGVNRLVIDLRAVSFIDSTGLGLLATTRKRFNGQGDAVCIVLEEEQATIRRLFSITGLDSLLPIHPTVDEAVENCLKDAA